jgi:hypothetical protein
MNVISNKNFPDKWEYDYFVNDIMNKYLYCDDIKFLFYEIKEDIDCLKIYSSEKNVLIINIETPINITEELIQLLNPVAVFHLSDETGKDTMYYHLYKKYSIKMVFHQYNFSNIDYGSNHLQIPLGYISKFKSGLTTRSMDLKDNLDDKKYDFSFVGAIKSDRKEMLNKLSYYFKNKFISTGCTHWSHPSKQRICPSDLHEIYKKSIFIPTGRGNYSLDCFRIYEAIVSRAIPIVVGSKNEIEYSFDFEGDKPDIVFVESWDEACKKCQNLLNSESHILNIINNNTMWWNRQLSKIIQILTNL